MKNISLIIPVKNEKESLYKTLNEVKKIKFIDEIIIVVDSKNDNSIYIAKKFTKKIIIQKKIGYGSAIVEGFNFATNKYACIFNADYSFNPKYLKLMTNKTKKYQFIFGSRYMKGGSSDDDTIITFVGNKIFTLLSKILLKINLSDVLFTYVLCNVNDFKKLKLKSNDFRLCIELPYQIQNKNFKYSEIPTRERKRYAGTKKVNEFKDGFLILTKIFECLFKK